MIVRKKLAAIDGFQGNKKWKNKNEGRKMRTYFVSVLTYNPLFLEVVGYYKTTEKKNYLIKTLKMTYNIYDYRNQ